MSSSYSRDDATGASPLRSYQANCKQPDEGAIYAEPGAIAPAALHCTDQANPGPADAAPGTWRIKQSEAILDVRTAGSENPLKPGDLVVSSQANWPALGKDDAAEANDPSRQAGHLGLASLD